jgi:hypothetical protein
MQFGNLRVCNNELFQVGNNCKYSCFLTEYFSSISMWFAKHAIIAVVEIT